MRSCPVLKIRVLALRFPAVIAAAVLLTSARPCTASVRPGPAAFLAMLETAANARDASALQQLTAPGIRGDYSWAAQPAGMMGGRAPWRARLLTVPGGGQLVTFSRYHPCESAGDHLYRLVWSQSGSLLGAEIPETDTLGTRIRHHDLAVRFDVPRKHVYITDRVQADFRPTTGTITPIVRLNSNYVVTAVKDLFGRPVPFRQAGGFIAIGEPGRESPAMPGPGFVLIYHADADQSVEDYVRPTHAALTSYWYPHTGRLPASSTVRITVPRGWNAIGQGEPTGKTVGHTETTFSWSNSLPVSYLTVAAGCYTVTTERIAGIAVSAYLLKPDSARAHNAIEVAAGALSWFSHNFSHFPYTRYAVVESQGFPAALECYSFTLCGSSLIPLAEVHEISHTWWGGVVPNTYTRSMWNESFAEYSDGLYCRQTGSPGMHEFTPKLVSQVAGGSVPNLLSAHDALDMAQSLAGYGKGSLVLENLEHMLGTRTMLACMRRFIADHRLRRLGEDAEWPDFVNAVAETAGQAWRGYFTAWLSRGDLPAFRLRDVNVIRGTDGGYTVSGDIVQSEPAFWAHVPLVVEQDGSADVTRYVDIKEADHPFRLDVRAKPLQVALDPQIETLRATPPHGPAATLLSMQTITGPLVVVYATGGSTAEDDAVRALAKGPLGGVFPFAKISVVPDTDATPSVLNSGSVLLLGRTASLRIPDAWKELLPLQYTDDAVHLGVQSWAGADLWGIVVFQHPMRPKALAAQAAGTGADAIRNFPHQADLDSLKGVFVVRGAGAQVAAEPSHGSDTTVVPLKP